MSRWLVQGEGLASGGMAPPLTRALQKWAFDGSASFSASVLKLFSLMCKSLCGEDIPAIGVNASMMETNATNEAKNDDALSLNATNDRFLDTQS